MLISVAQYRAITGDETSASGVVETAIADAQGLLEDRLGRGLELRERTERVRLVDGVAYPSATPITAVPSGQEVQGSAVLGVGPASVLVEPSDTHRSLTYTGGFDPAETDRSAVTFVPVELSRAVAFAAQAIIDRDSSSLVIPPGAISVRVGDVAVSWGAGGAPSTGEVIFPVSLVRRWRRRRDMAA